MIVAMVLRGLLKLTALFVAFLMLCSLALFALGGIAHHRQQSEMVVSCGQVSGGGDAMVADGSKVGEAVGGWIHQLTEPNHPIDVDAMKDWLYAVVRDIIWHAWIESFMRAGRGIKIDPQILRLREKAAQQAKAAEGACTPCPPGADTPEPPGAEPPIDPRVTLTATSSTSGRAAALKAASRYWSGAQLRIADAVAGAESGWDATALSPVNSDGTFDHGMWQINSVHRDLLAQGDWRSVEFNAWAAYKIWLAAGKRWTPWTTFKNGAYRSKLDAKIGAGKPSTTPTLPDQTSATCTTPQQGTGTPSSTISTGAQWKVTDPTSGVTYSLPKPTDPARRKAIEFAIGQLGKPYVFGSKGPDSWDCSSLVSAAWRTAGVTFTPYTEALVNEVSKTGTLQPGDLLYRPGHVQLYVGRLRGQILIIEAPRPGRTVTLRPQWMTPTYMLDPTMKGRPA